MLLCSYAPMPLRYSLPLVERSIFYQCATEINILPLFLFCVKKKKKKKKNRNMSIFSTLPCASA